MEKGQEFYICPICFRVCETEAECHEHLMVKCEIGHSGDEIRKPISDRFGNLVSRAPRWYLDAVKKVRETKKD